MTPNPYTAWPLSFTQLACTHCVQTFLADAALTASPCPNCHRTTLSEAADDAHREPSAAPELVIPFSVSAETLSNALSSFANRYYFTPADFTAANLQTRLQRVYLPMFLVDSSVKTNWQAEIGFDYDVISHDEVFRNNLWESIAKTETRIRWEPRTGTLERHYDNVRAPALAEHQSIIAPLGKFKLWETEVYVPQQLDQAFVRLSDRTPSDAWVEAEPIFLQMSKKDVEKACEAQHIRQFKWQPDYSQQYWSKLLLPVYTTYYLGDDGQQIPLYVHGKSGQVSGQQIASMRRALRLSVILSVIAATLFVLYLALFRYSSFTHAPFLLLLALAVGLAAILPIAYVYNLNQKG